VGRGELLKGCVATLGVLVLFFVVWVGGGREKRGESGLRVSPYLLPVSHTECCTLDRSRLSALIEFLRSVLRERGRGFLDLNCFPSKRNIVVTVTVTHHPE